MINNRQVNDAKSDTNLPQSPPTPKLSCHPEKRYELTSIIMTLVFIRWATTTTAIQHHHDNLSKRIHNYVSFVNGIQALAHAHNLGRVASEVLQFNDVCFRLYFIETQSLKNTCCCVEEYTRTCVQPQSSSCSSTAMKISANFPQIIKRHGKYKKWKNSSPQGWKALRNNFCMINEGEVFNGPSRNFSHLPSVTIKKLITKAFGLSFLSLAKTSWQISGWDWKFEEWRDGNVEANQNMTNDYERNIS